MRRALQPLALALLGLLVVSTPSSAFKGPWKVGVLWDTSIIPPHLVPLVDWLAADLKTQGFADSDLQLVVRKVEPAGFREATRELLRERVNAIWASSTAAALAAKAETQTVAIVFGVGVAPEKEVLRRESIDGYFYVLNGVINRYLVGSNWLNEARIPNMGYYLPGVAQGWNMAAYGSNHREAWRASARLLAKVLRGALPRDLPSPTSSSSTST